VDGNFTGPISKKILSEAFSEWATIHPMATVNATPSGGSDPGDRDFGDP
jgi:hypothetical protein